MLLNNNNNNKKETTISFSLAGETYHLPHLPGSSSSSTSLSSLNNNNNNNNISSSSSSSSSWLTQTYHAVSLVSFCPLLMVSGVLQQLGRLFLSRQFPCQCAAATIPCVCSAPDRHFRSYRHCLLAQQIQSTHVVLDVGSGDGMYLPYLKNAARIVSMEPNTEFHEKIRQKALALGMIEDSTATTTNNNNKNNKLEISGQTLETYHAQNPNQKFDWIVLGNVLCQVDDPQVALTCVDRMLQEPSSSSTAGGKIFFSEHIGSAKGSLARWVQDWINPLWRFGMDGCNVNRDTLAYIRAQPGWASFHVETTFMTIPWAVGLATKTKPSTTSSLSANTSEK